MPNPIEKGIDTIAHEVVGAVKATKGKIAGVLDHLTREASKPAKKKAGTAGRKMKAVAARATRKARGVKRAVKAARRKASTVAARAANRVAKPAKKAAAKTKRTSAKKPAKKAR
jgi:hypothetical protein